jgi:hypothetical protein
MEANPEVMPVAGAPPAPKPPLLAPIHHDGRDAEFSARPPVPGRGNATPRTSEDPMRRTDRYRLVMPWSTRL